MRALSRYPQLFKVGVAEYGFLAMRLMSLEGGDLTYELEYIGDIGIEFAILLLLISLFLKNRNFCNIRMAID